MVRVEDGSVNVDANTYSCHTCSRLPRATPRHGKQQRYPPSFLPSHNSQSNPIIPDGQNDILILSSLSNLQGLLLLHPPSRILFAREVYMNLLLDLLDPYNCPAIQSQALLVLVTALLATPQNTRTFEHMDGLLTVTSLFKDEDTTQNVKVKLLEFLYFYLMPETPPRRSQSKLAGAFDQRSSSGEGGGAAKKNTRSQDEKQYLLGKYLSNVDALVEDLQESAPFTSVAC
jgi:hypothetical protein